jgi:hypothetical protein
MPIWIVASDLVEARLDHAVVARLDRARSLRTLRTPHRRSRGGGVSRHRPFDLEPVLRTCACERESWPPSGCRRARRAWLEDDQNDDHDQKQRRQVVDRACGAVVEERSQLRYSRCVFGRESSFRDGSAAGRRCRRGRSSSAAVRGQHPPAGRSPSGRGARARGRSRARAGFRTRRATRRGGRAARASVAATSLNQAFGTTRAACSSAPTVRRQTTTPAEFSDEWLLKPERRSQHAAHRLCSGTKT